MTVIYLQYLAPHRADGGVCKNSFIMQMTSDLINETIDRPVHVDMSCSGAASLAGLAVGMCGFYENENCLAKPFLTDSISPLRAQNYAKDLESLGGHILHTCIPFTHKILL